jgi:hypothetical protein
MKRMPKSLRMQWGEVMDHHAPILEAAITKYEAEGDELAYLNATLEYSALPARFLAPIMGFKTVCGQHSVEVEGTDGQLVNVFKLDMGPARLSQKPLHEAFRNLSLDDADRAGLTRESASTIIRANELLHMDRNKTASKVLTGHGVAASNATTAKILSGMHPPAPGPLEFPEPNSRNQICISAIQCYEINQAAARQTESALGTFGWSDDMFYWQAGRRHNSKCNLMMQRSRMQSILIAGQVPIAVVYMSVAGTLTGLNKLDPVAQAKRLEDGLPPAIRPVNSGANILKAPCSVALESRSGKRVAHKVGAYNVGISTKSGAETISLVTRTCNDMGWLTPTQDVVNAFNSFHRQGMLDGVSKLWPEAQQIFNTFYGIEAPVIHSYNRENGDRCIRIILSKTGSRMGCKLGAMGYCITVHPIYDTLAREFKNDRVELSAIVDDLVPRFAPPMGGESWDDRYETIVAFIKRYDELANPCGMKRHPDKGKLFIPPGIPLPAVDSPLHNLLKINHDGVTVAGSFIGTEPNVIKFCSEKV